VFGVSSDEYLDNAKTNCREREEKGKDVVERYRATYAGTVEATVSAVENRCYLQVAVIDYRKNTLFRQSSRAQCLCSVDHRGLLLNFQVLDCKSRFASRSLEPTHRFHFLLLLRQLWTEMQHHDLGTHWMV